MLSRLVSVSDPRLSDASQPHGGQFLSSDEQTLAHREIFTGRTYVATIDARDFSSFPDLDPQSHNPGSSLCDDAASDLAEYGDSVQQHASSHGHSDFKGTMEGPNIRFKQEDPLSAFSVIYAGSERVAPDNAPRAEGDTSLDLSGDLSRPPKISGPTDAEYSHLEEMQDSLLPDFLDLSSDVESPQPQQVTHTIPPLGEVSSWLAGDESPAVAPEGTMAGPSGGRNQKRFGRDWADPVLAEPPISTRQVPRKVQSAGELARKVALDRGTSKPGTTDGEPQRSDSYRRRFPTQVLSARAAAFRAEVTRGGNSHRGYDTSTGSAAEYEGGHAHSRSAVEPSDLWRVDSYYNRRMQGLRNGDIQNLKRDVLVADDANPARESPNREMGPVTQRNGLMSPQEAVIPVSYTLRRPRASSAATSPTPSLSPRYHRTLGDRAYHHPDVPRTPLFSEHDHDSSPWSPGGILTEPRMPSTAGHDSDVDDRLISSPETESTFPSPRSESSLSPVPRQARPRLRAPLEDEAPPLRESYALAHPRPHGSGWSPDLPRGQSLFVGPPSASSWGIGLSTLDNGAFEAPRPAPTPTPAPAPPQRSRTREPNHHPPVAWRRKNSLRIRTGAITASADEGSSSSSSERSSVKSSPGFVRPLIRNLSLTRKASSNPNNPSGGAAVAAAAVARVATPAADPRVVRTASPAVLGFGAMSFRWQIWSKVQRSPTERSETPAPVGRLRAAGKSEPDIKASFIETEAKPQRKGLLFRKKKS